MKTSFFVLLFFFSLKSFSNPAPTSGRFILKGTLDGQDTGILILRYLEKPNKYVRDTIILKKGVFIFKGNIVEPSRATISWQRNLSESDESNEALIYIEPGQMLLRLEIGHFENAKLSGSITNSEYSLLKQKLHPYSKMEQAIYSSIKMYNDSVFVDSARQKVMLDSLNEQSDINRAAQKKIYIDFINQYSNSYVSAFYLFFLINSIYEYPAKDAKLLYDNFSTRVKKSNYSKQVEAKLNSQPGFIAPTFSATDINGNLVKLSDFKGKKYVLLDFWATWCGPCRAEIHNLLELYKKYNHLGFEIISIANDDERVEAWKKAIEEDKTSIFNQVLQGVGTANDLGEKFGVQPIPVKILINKYGIIMYRQEGRNDEQLNNTLRSVFD